MRMCDRPSKWAMLAKMFGLPAVKRYVPAVSRGSSERKANVMPLPESQRDNINDTSE